MLARPLRVVLLLCLMSTVFAWLSRHLALEAISHRAATTLRTAVACDVVSAAFALATIALLVVTTHAARDRLPSRTHGEAPVSSDTPRDRP